MGVAAAGNLPFDVWGYNYERFHNELIRFLSESKQDSDQADVFLPRKRQLSEIAALLLKHGTTTCVVEREYVDLDFYDDYAGYYARSFRRYRRRCRRFHFFSGPQIEADQFNQVIRDWRSTLTLNQLRDRYIGFVVIKPLPNTIIGRTCLKPLARAPKTGSEISLIEKTVTANLFGLPLEVKTLPFQEQDRDVSACATIALWTAFHATPDDFGNPRPSPVTITQSAGKAFQTRRRVLPNDGLLIEQFAGAIVDVGLEPEYVGVETSNDLKRAAYAFLKKSFPVIAFVELEPKLQGGSVDHHAVALTGYEIPINAHSQSPAKDSISFLADFLGNIFVHDDGVGPYSKWTFRSNPKEKYQVDTGWSKQRSFSGNRGGAVDALLAPLYHQIRIPFSDVIDALTAIDAWLRLLSDFEVFGKDRFVYWDVFLSNVRDFRSDLSDLPLVDDRKFNLLTRSFPKYLWRADAYVDSKPVVTILLDATQLRQASSLLELMVFRDEISSLAKDSDALGWKKVEKLASSYTAHAIIQRLKSMD